MELLEALRLVRLLVWLAVLVWLSGSAWRTFTGRKLSTVDPMWTLLWFNALAWLAYSGRWLAGLAPATETGTDLQTRIALTLLVTGIGIGVMWRRGVREGWRW